MWPCLSTNRLWCLFRSLQAALQELPRHQKPQCLQLLCLVQEVSISCAVVTQPQRVWETNQPEQRKQQHMTWRLEVPLGWPLCLIKLKIGLSLQQGHMPGHYHLWSSLHAWKVLHALQVWYSVPLLLWRLSDLQGQTKLQDCWMVFGMMFSSYKWEKKVWVRTFGAFILIETGWMSDVAGGLTCSWRGAFVATRAPGFAHAAAAELFAQLGRHWVQTLPPWADQTEASPLLLLDGGCVGWRGAQEEDKEEEGGGVGSGAPECRRHIHGGKRGQRVEK